MGQLQQDVAVLRSDCLFSIGLPNDNWMEVTSQFGNTRNFFPSIPHSLDRQPQPRLAWLF